MQAEAKTPIVSTLCTAKGTEHRELPSASSSEPVMRNSQHDAQATALSQSSARSSVFRHRERSRIQVRNYVSLSHDGKQPQLEARTSADKSTGSTPQEYHFSLSSPRPLQGAIQIVLGGHASATGSASAHLEIDLPSGTRIYDWKQGQQSICVQLPQQHLDATGIRVRVRTQARATLPARGFAHAAVKVAVTFCEDPSKGGK